MDTKVLRLGLAALAFFAIFHWSRPAKAEATITGTVGELGLVVNGFAGNNSGNNWLRFKMTNAAVTQACNTVNGYAVIHPGDLFYRDLYAMLLVSKKGSPITCAVDANPGACHVYACTLP